MSEQIKKFYDLYINDIQVVVKKKESHNFKYECLNRIGAGFIFICSGTAYFKNKENEFYLKQGDILIVDKEDKYVIGAIDDQLSYVTTAFLLGNGQRFRTYNIPYKISLDYSNFVEPTINKLLNCWKRKNGNYKIEARYYFEKFLIEITNKTIKVSMPNEKYMKIYNAITFINENYTAGIDLEKLANDYGYSPSHFRKLFIEYINMSPQQYICKIRIDTAKEMLSSGMFSILEVSENLGFYDTFHFSKDFKKNVGMSPKQYQTSIIK